MPYTDRRDLPQIPQIVTSSRQSSPGPSPTVEFNPRQVERHHQRRRHRATAAAATWAAAMRRRRHHSGIQKAASSSSRRRTASAQRRRATCPATPRHPMLELTLSSSASQPAARPPRTPAQRPAQTSISPAAAGDLFSHAPPPSARARCSPVVPAVEPQHAAQRSAPPNASPAVAGDLRSHATPPVLEPDAPKRCQPSPPRPPAAQELSRCRRRPPPPRQSPRRAMPGAHHVPCPAAPSHGAHPAAAAARSPRRGHLRQPRAPPSGRAQ